MAKSAQKKDDRDEDEKDTAVEDEEETESEENEDEDEEEEQSSEASDDDDDDDEEEDDDDDDDDDDEEEKPAAKARASAGSGKRPVVPSVSKNARAAEPPRRSGLGKSLLMFVFIVGGLAAAFALLGQESTTPPSAPKWKQGQQVDVEITLVSTDKADLSCAAAQEVAGKHCAFESKNKAWSKGSNDDPNLLKPYTTVDRIQFLAAGLWSQPALSGTLPPSRFSVKCKYKVEGQITGSAVRWNNSGPWYDQGNPIYAGSLSDCKIIQ